MKKSEITISMPLNTYEELNSYKEYYEGIRSNLESLLTAREQEKGIAYYSIEVSDLIKFIKSYLPYKYCNETIILNED